MPSAPISFVVLTLNEAANLPSCLESVGDLVDEIFVVDSGSTDATLEIARAAGAHIATHPFTTHSEQWAWALESLPLRNDWVLALDADQRVTPELADELRTLFAHGGPPAAVEGYYMKRRQIFRGTWIRHGGYYPKYLLKLFRTSAVRLDPSELLDHHFSVGRARRLDHDIIEANANEDHIAFWMQKHIHYAALLATESARPSPGPNASLARSWVDPAERAVLLKRTWRRFPLYWRGVAFFFYRYVVRLGFLDGRQAFIFHFFQSCWFRVLVDVMIEERAADALAATGADG